jgi:hypothetical protein
VRQLLEAGSIYDVRRAVGEIGDDLAVNAVVDAQIAAGLGDVVARPAVVSKAVDGAEDVDADGG